MTDGILQNLINKTMKKITFLIALFGVLAITLTSFEERPIHIFMAGDSTMADKVAAKDITDSITGKKTDIPFAERGWGQLLPKFFNKNVVIENFAKNGRSSRTFISEGLWDKLLSGVQPGDYVVIQFAHNDASIEKTDRYTSPADYYANLSRFVDEVKAQGGNPIICTSVVRRKFDKKGNFVDSHGEYLDISRKVAAEKNIPLIDMYEKSKKAITGIGEAQSAELFMHFAPGDSPLYPDGKIDNTHFKEKGARLMASLFVEGLREQNIEALTGQLVE